MRLRRPASVLVLAPCIFCLRLSAQAPVQPVPASAPATNTNEAQYGPLRKIGGGVKPPVVTHTSEPKFSEEARKKRFNGVVLVGLIVDTHGVPQNVHIIRGVGMGLDENAVKAVSKYRFKPAMENGTPVAVMLNVEIHFQIFDNPDEAAAAARNGGKGADTASGNSDEPIPDPDDPVHGYK